MSTLLKAKKNPVLIKSISPTDATWAQNPYIQAATADNTRRAYRSDIRHFEAWGGLLPATSAMLVQYLQAFAESLNPRTLARRITALKHWHEYQSLADPTQHPLIKKTLTGIMRVHGTPKEKALPLSPADLAKMVIQLKNTSGLAALRDNALLQIGYFGSFRRSELVGIRYEHIQWQPEGIEILLPTSKTDPLHTGQHVAIPFGKSVLCPIHALKTWLEASSIDHGYIFSSIKKGNMMTGVPITPVSVNHILTKRAKAAGVKNAAKLSSHSLRRGFTTHAYLSGAKIEALMRQGRWKKTDTLMGYIENIERFKENAAESLYHALDKKLGE